MFWQGKRVFLTGHTGFKGSWLSLWLQSLGAELTGYSLEPPTSPSLFETASVASGMRSITGEVCDLPHLKQTMAEFKPEIVFHMAAQSLVRVSYEDPILTYQTNVMGTANVLEAVRKTESVSAVLVITTDKCYENRNWCWGYREIDTLGGHDPYSNSKACAEFVVSAYRNSFFEGGSHNGRLVALASARAGNAIGGGDWAQDRLVPDIVRSFAEGKVLKIRNPQAIRPWQYVLEPLRGYLMLAQKLYEDGANFGSGWNFGPDPSDIQPVRWIVEKIADTWGSPVVWEIDHGEHPYEAQMLHLDCSKAAQQLGWRPVLRLPEALSMTIEWYQHFLSGKNAREKCLEQISAYCAKADRENSQTSVVPKNVTAV
ncbi:MAG: CDP-glucose 4,6-dehydratase [Candidatus Korobacteraceae bacterium]|jgi:CDP-glucose 4,6-dehydratase